MVEGERKRDGRIWGRGGTFTVGRDENLFPFLDQYLAVFLRVTVLLNDELEMVHDTRRPRVAVGEASVHTAVPRSARTGSEGAALVISFSFSP